LSRKIPLTVHRIVWSPDSGKFLHAATANADAGAEAIKAAAASSPPSTSQAWPKLSANKKVYGTRPYECGHMMWEEKETPEGVSKTYC
jgi:hypothetical protein